MPLTRTTKLIIFTGVACGGLLLFTALFSNDGLLSEPVFRPKEGEIVALYSKHSGKYLEVSQEDAAVLWPSIAQAAARVKQGSEKAN